VTKAAILILVLSSFMLGGCAEPLSPSEGAPSLAVPGIGANPRVAFCYNRFTTTLQRLDAMARDACGAGFTPRPVEDKDMVLSACPIATPARMTYVCFR
jgi:hypothetical protein